MGIAPCMTNASLDGVSLSSPRMMDVDDANPAKHHSRFLGGDDDHDDEDDDDAVGDDNDDDAIGGGGGTVEDDADDVSTPALDDSDDTTIADDEMDDVSPLPPVSTDDDDSTHDAISGDDVNNSESRSESASTSSVGGVSSASTGVMVVLLPLMLFGGILISYKYCKKKTNSTHPMNFEMAQSFDGEAPPVYKVATVVSMKPMMAEVVTTAEVEVDLEAPYLGGGEVGGVTVVMTSMAAEPVSRAVFVTDLEEESSSPEGVMVMNI
jgi:hypothetical protein